MFKGPGRKRPFPWLIRCSLAALGLLTFNPRAMAEVVTWDGEAGESDEYWHTASNWSGNTIPVAGDDVVFPDLGEGYKVKYDPQD